MWRDADGRLSATAWAVPGGRVLVVPNVGRFTFVRGSDDVRLDPEPGVADDVVDDAFHRIALPLGLQFHGRQVLHASAVTVAGGVVALCGASGAGKSTLAFALSRRGHPLCADDAVAFDPATCPVMVACMPFRMRLRPASADWFDAPEFLKGLERGSDWQEGARAPFRAAFVLEQEPDPDGPDVCVRRIPAVDAFGLLLPHAYYAGLDDPGANRLLVSGYFDLVERVPVFSLRYRPALEILHDVTTAVETTVASL